MSRKPSRKTIKRKLDDAWRQLVKANAGFRCERCTRTASQGFQMHAHHSIGRRVTRLRYDVRNGVCLCVLCHGWAGDFPHEHVKWRHAYRPDDWIYCVKTARETTHYTDTDLLEILADLEGSLELAA